MRTISGTFFTFVIVALILTVSFISSCHRSSPHLTLGAKVVERPGYKYVLLDDGAYLIVYGNTRDKKLALAEIGCGVGPVPGAACSEQFINVILVKRLGGPED